MDAILNYTFLPHIWNVYPSFFQSPMGPLHGSRVKIRGHMIAHRTPLSPRTKGGFGRVILAIRRLNRGEEVMSDGMMSESGLMVRSRSLETKLRLDIGRNEFKSVGLRLNFLRSG